MTEVLIKRIPVKKEIRTKQSLHEDTGQCHLQGMSKIDRKPPEARKQAWNKFSLKALRPNQVC